MHFWMSNMMLYYQNHFNMYTYMIDMIFYQILKFHTRSFPLGTTSKEYTWFFRCHLFFENFMTLGKEALHFCWLPYEVNVSYVCLSNFLPSSWFWFQDAAELYEFGCHFETAGALYMICKKYNKVMNILQHTTSPKLQIMVGDLWALDAKNFPIK